MRKGANRKMKGKRHLRRQRNMIGPRKKIMLEEQLVDHPTHYITSIIFSIEYVYRVAIFVQKRYTPPVRKASREVANLTDRRNPHTPYMVSKNLLVRYKHCKTNCSQN